METLYGNDPDFLLILIIDQEGVVPEASIRAPVSLRVTQFHAGEILQRGRR